MSVLSTSLHQSLFIGGHGVGQPGAGVQPGGTLLSLAGAAGAQPAGLAFSLGAANGSALDGAGHYVLTAGSGFAMLTGAGPQGDGYVTLALAAPGSIGFVFRAVGPDASQGCYYFGQSGGAVGVFAFAGGTYDSTIVAPRRAVPTGTQWTLGKQGNRVALWVDGALVLTFTDAKFLAGGLTGFRLLDGATAGVSLAAVTASAAGPAFPAITGLALTLAPVSTAMLKGMKVGQATSATPSGGHLFTVSGADAGLVTLDAAGGSLMLAADHPRAGPLALTVADADSGLAATATATGSVVTGQTLPGSAITLALPAMLTNAVPLGIVGTASVAGMTGTVAWIVQQQGGSQVGVSTRWAMGTPSGPASAPLTATCRLAAGTLDPVTIVATNGVDVAALTLAVMATSVVGPTFDVGPNQSYTRFDQVGSYLVEREITNGAPVLGDAGPQIRIHAQPDNPRALFGALNVGSGAPGNDRSKGLAFNYTSPYSLIGVPDPATGALPLTGGDAGAYGHGAISLTGNRDVSVSFFEIAWCLDGPNNLAAIRGDVGMGNLTLDAIYAHNNHNSALITRQGVLAISRFVSLMAGTGDAGYTHGMYVDAFEARISNVLSAWVNGGHCIKSRALVTTVSDFVAGDGMIGRSSYILDFPEGGKVQVSRGMIIKGPCKQNEPLVAFGEEVKLSPTAASGYPQNPGNELHFDSVAFVNLSGDPYGTGGAIGVNIPQAYLDLDTGLPTIVTFTNCTVFGLSPERFLMIAGQPAATAYPPGVTALAEPPPLDFRSKLPAGILMTPPAVWTAPNLGRHSNGDFAGDRGVIVADAHEIRVPWNTPAGTKVAQLHAWGRQDAAATDPGFDPYAAGAVWSNDPSVPGYGFTFAGSPYLTVHPDGGLYTTRALAGAPVLNIIHPGVNNAAGTRPMDGLLPVVFSDVPARTDGIPASFSRAVRPVGQEALG